MWDMTEAVEYYKKQGAPADQTALTELLKEVQREHGGSIPQQLLEPLAQALGTKQTFLQALIRRKPSLRLDGRPLLEICGGRNCRGAALAETVRREFPGVQVQLVGCQRMCGKGPNVRLNGQLHHKADLNLVRRLLKEL